MLYMRIRILPLRFGSATDPIKSIVWSKIQINKAIKFHLKEFILFYFINILINI
jgi:hypothetical protein